MLTVGPLDRLLGNDRSVDLTGNWSGRGPVSYTHLTLPTILLV